MIPKQYIELLKNRKECVYCQGGNLITSPYPVCRYCNGSDFEPLTLIFPEKVLECQRCDNFKIELYERDTDGGYLKCKSCDGYGLIWKEGDEYWIGIDCKPFTHLGKCEHKIKFKILSLERKRLNELDMLIDFLIKEFGEIKEDEEMILVKV